MFSQILVHSSENLQVLKTVQKTYKNCTSIGRELLFSEDDPWYLAAEILQIKT